jgi:hypothetical protein
VKAVRADAMAVQRLSAHLAAALRTRALILANTISMGVKGVLELILRITSALNGRSPG